MKDNYIQALKRDIRVYGKDCTKEVETIYIGGGTPSILALGIVESLIHEIRLSFRVSKECEITIECNPGTLNEEKLTEYKRAGVNRLSIGLQSADNEELKLLGRIHTYEEFQKNFVLARKCGFTNISVDLMMAIPSQTLTSYNNTLLKICGLSPEHISAYELIVEPETHFQKWFEEHPEDFPTEELACELYHHTIKTLKSYGYQQYEISNFSKPGAISQHNYGYWSNEEYLGLGLGASSYCNGIRTRNTTSMEQYLLYDEKESVERVTRKESEHEFFFLGLRRTKGISEQEYELRFHEQMPEKYKEILARYTKLGLVEKREDKYYFTVDGILVSNQVLADFLI